MQASESNFTVNNSSFYRNDIPEFSNFGSGSNFTKVSSKFNCRVNDTWAKDILEKTSQFTRIYVFFGNRECLRIFMGQMRKVGLFSDSEITKDPYIVIYVETIIENPNLFKYLWNRTESDPKFVHNCTEIKDETGDRWNQWKSLIVVSLSK